MAPRKTIARCQPLLYVEADREARRDDLLRWLAGRGYTMYWHQVPLYNPANFKGNPTNVFEGVVSLNVLAVPVSVRQDIVGLERVDVRLRPLSPLPVEQEALAPGSTQARSGPGAPSASARARKPPPAQPSPRGRGSQAPLPLGEAGVRVPPHRRAASWKRCSGRWPCTRPGSLPRPPPSTR